MRLKIAAKIILGFGGMTLFVILNSLIIYNRTTERSQLTEEINQVYSPSVSLIRELQVLISDSRMLIKSWVNDNISDTPNKLKLKKLHDEDYNAVIDTLLNLSKLWKSEDFENQSSTVNPLNLLEKINTTITDTLFEKHKYIMSQLNSFVSYEDAFIIFEIEPMVEDRGEVMELTDAILADIIQLIDIHEENISDMRKEMDEQDSQFMRLLGIMLAVLLVVAVLMSTFTILSLSKPINRTKNILREISKGKFPENKLKEGNDEIGQMAKALNAVVSSLKNIAQFATEIGRGNFDMEFKPLSDEDKLGYSLLEMRGELQKAKTEEEIRAEENRQRTWASQGVALFSDIQRKHNDNLNDLSFEIISNLVKYTNSNQGGIFVVNDNDADNIFLEMKACYAYDRQKFIKKRIEVGEGLVGRCYQEQEKIFLTDIPNDYIKISSGLGEESPNCLLLIPLAYNDNIFGIIEIASFNIYRDFEIEFIERIGESIAATISSVKANVQTQILLEQSQQQAEEMSAQEEEMRQNMEELRATQEQSARREQELIREVESLKKQISNNE